MSISQGALPETLNLNKVGASNIKGKHMELNFDHPKSQILKTHKWFPLFFLLRGEHGRLPRYPQEASEMPREKRTLTVSYGFPGFPAPPGSVLRRFTEGQRWSEKVREGQEKVGEGQRRSEKVREGQRKCEKVWESMIK